MSDQRYLVTARKYRPIRFEDLVGQSHVTETLQNAIRLDRLAHAYLFSGPRGVGKTTAARILAKAINCETPLDQRDGSEPCGACDSCQTFAQGRSLNIIEIDAASNNKVDDIRDLRETVRIPPQGARKKVYIVDEVHMLSTSAFNALLKTLEEPPPYALFIFATTEPHKVLPTILSRCQRFDFRRIRIEDAVQRLREICQAENVTADEDALALIARKGDGALRDTLSAFDQAVALCGSDLRYAALAEALGVVEQDLFFEVSDALAQRRTGDLFLVVDRVVSRGYDLMEFLHGLQEHLRNILVAVTLPDAPDLIEAARGVRARYVEAAQAFEEADVMRLLALAADGEETLRQAVQPRLRLEMTLAKMASLAKAVDLNRAIAQVEALQQAAREGKPALSTVAATPEQVGPPTRQAAPSGVVRESAPAPIALVAPAPHAAPLPAPDPHPAEPESPPARPAPKAEPHHAKIHALRPRTDDEGGVPAEPAAPKKPTPAAPAKPSTPETAYSNLFGAPALRKVVPRKDGPNALSGDGAAGSAARMPEPTIHAAAPAPTASSGIPSALANAWKTMAERVNRPALHAVMTFCTLSAVEGDTLCVAVPDQSSLGVLRENEQTLERMLAHHAPNGPSRLRFFATKAERVSPETGSSETPLQRFTRLQAEHPVLSALVDTFGGELVH